MSQESHQKLKVLVACECSGVVRDAFIGRGHNAISCDILPSDVGGPHYKGDVFDIIDDDWDLLIAHPPCTYLSVSGNRWLYNKDGTKNKERWKKRWDALDFVWKLMHCDIEKICIENPRSVISSEIRKPDQLLQPWQFGDPAQKETFLWLKNLSPLYHFGERGGSKGEFVDVGNGKKMPKWYNDSFRLSDEMRQKVRSKTFKGIANAMAEQWGK
jgi:site-specific DNA-cytosine methylase